jgi:hypothetical protein
MNRLFQAFAMAAVAMAPISPFIAECGSRSHLLDEDAALDLLQRSLKSDSIYEKRISPDCIAYGTEETTNAYFGFVLREIHNAKCRGDPDVNPAIDRYRVYRRSGKITRWNSAEDKWEPYKPALKQRAESEISSVRKSRPLGRARS